MLFFTIAQGQVKGVKTDKPVKGTSTANKSQPVTCKRKKQLIVLTMKNQLREHLHIPQNQFHPHQKL